MKILNLYACLGGNRYKWNDVKSDIEVTAVELDPECARLYQERFPNDKVIVADAHKYLLDLKNSGELDSYSFVWSSPPCPSHSRMRLTNTGQGERKSKATYPDMKLYEEIIFLQHFFKGKYCVENVIPYYEPLILAKKRGRHLYWTNFNLPNDLNERKASNFINSKVGDLSDFHDYDFSKYKGNQRVDKIARNLVDYEAGKTIFETVLGIYKQQNTNQTKLF
jgi:DNA (cytosine-5)-methyltransferase 1|tara:strand:- start:59 stop:724 length:666 start_codon:yes stop_codon:yes gene_type:complete